MMAHSLSVQNALRTADPEIIEALASLSQIYDEARAKAAPIVETLINLSGMDEPADAEDFRTDIPATLSALLDNAGYHVGMALINAEDRANEEPEHDEDAGLYSIGDPNREHRTYQVDRSGNPA